MNIPVCPNHRQSVSLCEESRLRLLGENDKAFVFFCGCCKLLWAVSKPKTKDKARWENQVRRVQQASEMERELAKKKGYSFGQ